MARLIDADKLKETIHINHYPLRGGINSIDNGMWTIGIDQAIDEQTIIDAEPVRHGHWILEREPNGKPYCFHCSVCDDDFHHIGIKSATDYCPNCGAKMDEVEK